MAKLALQRIFQQGYVAFEHGHRLPRSVRQAAWAILSYRTAGFRRPWAALSGGAC
jgi:Ni/Co efflux regulator RcnB